MLVASSGVFYVVKLPGEWAIVVGRYADLPEEMDHTAFWESRACPQLAQAWSSLAGLGSNLREILDEHAYGFPRGRVVCRNGLYHVYHGQDLPNTVEVNRDIIERAFGIVAKAKWVEDDHEHCLTADKEAIREALGLEENWKAV